MKWEKLETLFAGYKLEAMLLSGSAIIPFVTQIADDGKEIFLYITKTKRIVVAPTGTVPSSDAYELKEYDTYYFETATLKEESVPQILKDIMNVDCVTGVDFCHVPYGVIKAIEPNKLVDIGEALRNLYRKKTEEDIHEIEKVLAYNESAFQAVKTLKIGQTDFDMYDVIGNAYRKLKGEPVDFQGDFLVGNRTGEISGAPNGTVIKEGDCCIADLLPRVDGYSCDTTRTFFFGNPSEQMKKAYMALLFAIAEGEKCLKDGMSCRKVYETISAAIVSSGFSPLPHHAGHGVGFSRYEAPYFTPSSVNQLLEGDVVTLEPGIYMGAQGQERERWGIRIENNYRVGKDSSKCLGNVPLTWEEFIVG